jgi:hypothetical protein
MLSDFDELELLALIEGDLPAEKAASLRSRLAGTPGALERIEAMIADRALLRVEPEPVMPRDLLADIEAALARPMLMQECGDAQEIETSALPSLPSSARRMGEFRRQHRRPMIRRRIMRLALAASVAVAAGAGVWIGLRSDFVRLPTLQWAFNEAAPPPGPEHAPSDGPRMSVRNESNDHTRDDSRSKAEADGQRRSDKPSLPAGPIPARLVLVIHAPQPAEAEELAGRIVAGRSDAAALVQNFSYEEAKQIEERLLIAQGMRRATSERDRIVAGPGRMSDLARSVAQDSATRVTLPRRDLSQPHPGSRQLAGPRDLAASLVQQLEFSSRGATHTITVRAGDLETLLADLHAAGAKTTLRPLPDEPLDQPSPRPRGSSPAGTTAPSPELLWARTLPLLRELLVELDLHNDDALVLLPVTIERR